MPSILYNSAKKFEEHWISVNSHLIVYSYLSYAINTGTYNRLRWLDICGF